MSSERPFLFIISLYLALSSYIVLAEYDPFKDDYQEGQVSWSDRVTNLLSSENLCPEGGVLRGAAPPSGDSVYCSHPKYGSKYKHGPELKFWHDGTPKQLTTYRNQIKHGPVIKFYKSGKKELQGQYSSGKLHGLVKKYNAFEEVIEHINYERGELISKNKVAQKNKFSQVRPDQKTHKLRFICTLDPSMKNQFSNAIKEYSASKSIELKHPPLYLLDIEVEQNASGKDNFISISNIKFATKLKSPNEQEVVDKFYTNLEKQLAIVLKNVKDWKVALNTNSQETKRLPASNHIETKKIEYKDKTLYFNNKSYSVLIDGELLAIKNLKMKSVNGIDVPTHYQFQSTLIKNKSTINIEMKTLRCKIL